MPGDKSGCTLNHNQDAGHHHLNKSDKVERAHEEGVEQEKKGGKPEMLTIRHERNKKKKPLTKQKKIKVRQ